MPIILCTVDTLVYHYGIPTDMGAENTMELHTDPKGWISERAAELINERIEKGDIFIAAKRVENFTYQVEANVWISQDDCIQAWQDAELDYAEALADRADTLADQMKDELILCEGRR